MANRITIVRFPLLLVYLLLIYVGGAVGQLIAVPYLLALMLMDSLDGTVARRLKQTTLLGSVLDIAADRTLEMTLWICMVDLDLLPVAVPIIVVTRGALVDAVRSVGARHGRTPFSLMRTEWARWLVGSQAMRLSYGVSKAIAFCILTLALGLRSLPAANSAHGAWQSVALVGQITAWIAVAFCLLRGIPVIYEAPVILQGIETDTAPAS